MKTNQSSIISCSDAAAAPGRYLGACCCCLYDKEGDSNDDDPLVTVLHDSTDVNIEVSNEDSYDLDLSLSAVANVIADATFTTGAHILESQDIWIADTGATSHVTKHAEGRTKHRQTSVQTQGFAG